MKILNDNVLVKNVRPIEHKEIGGIIISEKAQTERYAPDVGEVVDFGEDVTDLEKGMTVILAPMKGKEYKDMKLYRHKEIFGIIST